MSNHPWHRVQLDAIETTLIRMEAKLDQLLKKKPKKRQQPELPAITEYDIPDFISPGTWAKWVQFRKEKKQPLTTTTIREQLKRLTKWRALDCDINKIILTSIANGWTGLFVPSEKRVAASSSVKYVTDNHLADWAKRNGAPPPKQQADYSYDKYRADLVEWEQIR